MKKFNFEQELIKYKPDLMTFAMKLTNNRNDSRDLVQETFYKALVNKSNFNNTNLKSWAFTILKNIFINDYRRNQKVNINMGEKIPVEFTYAETRMANAEEILAEQELQRLINKIHIYNKEAFKLYVKGYKYAEIASIQNIPLGTVKSRVFQARKQLIKLIKDEQS